MGSTAHHEALMEALGRQEALLTRIAIALEGQPCGTERRMSDGTTLRCARHSGHLGWHEDEHGVGWKMAQFDVVEFARRTALVPQPASALCGAAAPAGHHCRCQLPQEHGETHECIHGEWPQR